MFNIDKMRDLCKDKGIKIGYVCRNLGIASNYFSTLAAGNTTINMPRIIKIADILNTTVEYLTDETDDPTRPEEKENAVRLSILGEIAGGIPIEQIIDMQSDEWEEIPAAMARGGQYFALKIKGESMEPRISDGDVVIVRAQPDVENGQIAVVGVDGELATCKQIKKNEQGIMLVGFNPSYTPRFFTWDEVEKTPVTIFGRVVERRTKF